MLSLLELFSKQGHSGFSAPYVLDLFSKLSQFKPINPLSGEDNEWTEVSKGVFQNKRCSLVFKENDVAYDIQGIVWYEWMYDDNGEPFKSYYTNKDSHVNITFPYTPKTEYKEALVI